MAELSAALQNPQALITLAVLVLAVVLSSLLLVSLFSPLLLDRGMGDTPDGAPVPSELGLKRLLVLLFLTFKIGKYS